MVLKLSICDVIGSQKGSNGDGKLHFFVLDYILLAFFVQKYIFGQRYSFFSFSVLKMKILTSISSVQYPNTG